ncbi:MAG: DUF559 domain-containing protein, partial [Sphingobacteriaceae bacterium]
MITPGQKIIQEWYKVKEWRQFPFQQEMEATYLAGYSGLLNAPTGSGKTFALFLPFLADFINKHPDYKTRKNNGLQMIWLTPLRALTNDIKKAMQEVCDDLQIPWKIATRTGDTSAAEKAALKKKLPEVLLTTPESLHLMLAQKEYPKIFQTLQVAVIDEWHELLGTKRGVQVELGLSRLKNLTPTLSKGEGANEQVVKDKVPRFYTTDALNWNANIDNAKQNRRQPTEAENVLWQFLRGKKIGYKFRRQHLVLRYIPDFICIEKKLIVEVDGGYHNDAEQQELDKYRENELIAQGYTIVRFTNNEVLTNPDNVLSKIKQILETKSNSLPEG